MSVQQTAVSNETQVMQEMKSETEEIRQIITQAMQEMKSKTEEIRQIVLKQHGNETQAMQEMKSKTEEIRQIMLKQHGNETQSMQEMNSKIEEIRQTMSHQHYWSRNEQRKTGVCHPGFTYLPASKSCYKVVFESHNWTSAAQKCQDIRSGSHLVAITSAEENNALKTFLATELSRNEGNTACIPNGWPGSGNEFWTCGRHQIEDSCQTPFVWKVGSDQNVLFSFTNWQSGEPTCGLNIELCMNIAAKKNFRWNDIPCNVTICPLCEYES